MSRLDLKKALSPELLNELEYWAKENQTSPTNLAACIIRGELVSRQDKRDSCKIGVALRARKMEWEMDVHKSKRSLKQTEVERGRASL